MKIKFNIESKIDDKLTIEKLKKVLFKSMIKMHELAVINCPVDKGRLRNSIKIFPFSPGALSYILYAGVEYAPDVEFGTSPHVIKPVNKKALKFKVDNKTIFSKKIMHPGTEAQPYFRPALDQVKGIWVKRYMNQEFGKKI